MPDDMSFFREQMFKNAAVTGAAQSDRMLTPNSIKDTEKASAISGTLEKFLIEAEKRGEVDRKDPVFRLLVDFFLSKAATLDGKTRALGMAISVARKLNSVFEFKVRG